jgi:hypothetical protein
MKLLNVFLLLSLSLNLFAQDKLSFSNVVEIEATQEELYNRAKVLIANLVKNPHTNVKIDNKDQIIVSVNEKYFQKKLIWGGIALTEGFIEYNIEFNFKEGKFRYILSDFYHDPFSGSHNSFGVITEAAEFPRKFKGLNSKKWNNLIWNDLKLRCHSVAREIGGLIESEMLKKGTIEEEW